MKLGDIFIGIDFDSNMDWEEIRDRKIKDIAYNSREARKDYIFVAIEGEATDGHKYVMDAYERGCRVFVLNKDVDLPKDGVKIFVESSRASLSKISANFFGHPSKEITMIGITGTKGKTTTSNYIRNIIEESGISTGIIGTNGIIYKGIVENTVNTTPESYELQRILRKMILKGIKCVVMEVSSGGLMMKRVNDIDFDIGVFTNISPDHIGPTEHPTFDHYLKTKASLFQLVKHGIVNIDDEKSDYILKNASSSIDTISIDKPSDFQARDINLSKSLELLGSTFLCKTKSDTYEFELATPGLFNIYNALAAIAVCRYLKIDIEVIKKALKETKVEGRAEVLPILDYASIIVDFAHNGVSLQNILSTLKEYKPNRLVCLIGSIGKRAQIRRKELGDVAARECDICIITSDNPDFEDPNKIIEDIALSFKDSDCQVIKEADRKKAIEKGIQILEKGDIFLIAGKGHERYNLVNGVKEYFCDREVAIKSVNQLLKEDRTRVS